MSVCVYNPMEYLRQLVADHPWQIYQCYGKTHGHLALLVPPSCFCVRAEKTLGRAGVAVSVVGIFPSKKPEATILVVVPWQHPRQPSLKLIASSLCQFFSCEAKVFSVTFAHDGFPGAATCWACWMNIMEYSEYHASKNWWIKMKDQNAAW